VLACAPFGKDAIHLLRGDVLPRLVSASACWISSSAPGVDKMSTVSSKDASSSAEISTAAGWP